MFKVCCKKRHNSGFTSKKAIWFFVICVVASASGSNIIIDHSNWDWYTTQPQAVTNAVASQKIFFAHASVGGNVLDGFSNLHTANAVKFPLTTVGANATPPGSTANGVIYEYNRGNPGWEAKTNDFMTYVHNGWRNPKVSVVMNKFCYIDQTANWQVYRDSMLALETAFPTTKFIYWTIPLQTNSDGDEVLRAKFNSNLRNWINAHDNKLLFDIADIEAWSPAGEHQTFIANDTAYERMYSGFTSDGGHLNSTGSARMATGLYSLFGQLAALPTNASVQNFHPMSTSAGLYREFSLTGRSLSIQTHRARFPVVELKNATGKHAACLKASKLP